MTTTEDEQNGRYLVRGGINIRNGTSLQNMHEGTAYDLQPTQFGVSLNSIPAVVVGVIYSSTTVNTLAAITARQEASGEVSLRTNSMGAPLTFSSPTSVDVGNATEVLVAANSSRRYLLITNYDDTDYVYLGIGVNAEAAKGIRLAPGGSYEMSVAAGNISTAAINAISNAASSIVGVQEAV